MNQSQIQRPIGFRPGEISCLVNDEIISQHAEEAAFQWILRDVAVYAPNYNLQDLSELDERVEAHLDGLRVAGDVGWKFCEEALENEEPGEIFAASVLAFESGDTDRIQKVLDVGCSDPELERALISALGWIPYKNINNFINDLLFSESPEIRRVGIAASSIHRRDPGHILSQFIVDPNTRLRSRAIKAAGELGRTDLVFLILQSILDTDDVCQFYAAWSVALLGKRTPAVFDALCQVTEELGPYSEKSLDMALRCMELSQAKEWLQQLRAKPEFLRLAVIGSGVIGDPALADDLVTLMDNAEVSRVAGESFSIITGVDLAYDDLEGDEPEDFKGGPREDSEDEGVAMDKDEDLPWPAPGLVARWWKEHQGSFKSGRRYLGGKEITVELLSNALIHGNQRQRSIAALELAIREPARPLFEIRANGKYQTKLLMK